MMKEGMDVPVDLSRYFMLVKSKIYYLIICMFVGVGLASIYTYFIVTPKYGSTTQLIAQSGRLDKDRSPTNELNELNTNILLINTYKDILQSNNVLDETQKRLAKEGVKVQTSAIKQMISIKQSQNSQMFEIDVVSQNPGLSQLVGLKLCKVFQEQAERYNTIERVSIVSPASFSKIPVSPNNTLNLLLGFVLGLVVGLGIIFVLELVNQTITDVKFVTEEGALPVLGTLSEVSEQIIEDCRKINLEYYRQKPALFYRSFEFDRRKKRKRLHEKTGKRRK